MDKIKRINQLTATVDRVMVDGVQRHVVKLSDPVLFDGESMDNFTQLMYRLLLEYNWDEEVKYEKIAYATQEWVKALLIEGIARFQEDTWLIPQQDGYEVVHKGQAVELDKHAIHVKDIKEIEKC